MPSLFMDPQVDCATKRVDSPWDAQDPEVVGFESPPRRKPVDCRPTTAVACPPTSIWQFGLASAAVRIIAISARRDSLGLAYQDSRRVALHPSPMTSQCRAMSRETSF